MPDHAEYHQRSRSCRGGGAELHGSSSAAGLKLPEERGQRINKAVTLQDPGHCTPPSVVLPVRSSGSAAIHTFPL